MHYKLFTLVNILQNLSSFPSKQVPEAWSPDSVIPQKHRKQDQTGLCAPVSILTVNEFGNLGTWREPLGSPVAHATCSDMSMRSDIVLRPWPKFKRWGSGLSGGGVSTYASQLKSQNVSLEPKPYE